MANETLLDINRRAIHAKLDRVYKKKIGENTYYLANGLISSVSEAIARDKRLINNYTDHEVIILMHQSKNCRFLTESGVKRYIHDGKIYSYANVCSYFGIAPQDKKELEKIAKFNKCKDGDRYVTSMILKFIYGKRKQISGLNLYCTKYEIQNINIASNSKTIKARHSWVINQM